MTEFCINVLEFKIQFPISLIPLKSTLSKLYQHMASVSQNWVAGAVKFFYITIFHQNIQKCLLKTHPEYILENKVMQKKFLKLMLESYT